MSRRYVTYLLVFILVGCKKIHYYADHAIVPEPARILAHRGGGNAMYRDNSLEAIKASLIIRDGIEIDVQISKNQHVWLSHSPIVEACNISLACFAETTDQNIRAITTCNGSDIHYTNLEDVFQFMSINYPEKLISIDLKYWNPCGVNSLDVEGAMRKEAEIILDMAAQYQLINNIKFESETASLLNHVRDMQTEAEVYLTSFGDFEKAMLLCLKSSYTGISFKNNSGEVLSKVKLELLHRKGLKVMVWNLKSNEQLADLIEMKADYIQQDL